MDRHTHDDPFVAQQLAALTPAWMPDTAHGRATLDDALRARQAPRAFVAAGVAALLLVAVTFTPQVRTYAQDVWARWTMTRVEVVTTTMPGPFSTRGSFSGGGTFAMQADAERAAGFAVHLPPADVVGDAQQFVLVESAVVEETIDVPRLEAALRTAGATDVTVPREWDGASVRAHVRNVVVARYADGLTVTQAALPSLDVPVGIPLNDLATTIFRASGMPAEAARAAGLAYAIRPAWLLRVRAGNREHVERLSLRNGEAWLIADVAPGGRVSDVLLMRSNDTRIYVVTSPNREQAIAVAEALP
ncbi:MAG: hypothetical protein IT183_06715 [Acidobacteria bacterium]|nr:hypothetical protein [Acidobacteriota bacterium]